MNSKILALRLNYLHYLIGKTHNTFCFEKKNNFGNEATGNPNNKIMQYASNHPIN